MSGFIERLGGVTATPDEKLRVLDIDEAASDDVLDALSTETRRAAFRTLFDSPATASEIADRIDTSVQNVHYHLETLEEAGLVEPIDTRYSPKGNEMTVYAPATDPLVFVGDGEIRPTVQQSLTEVVGGIGVLGVGAILVQWGAERIAKPAIRSGSAGPASPDATVGEPGTLSWLVFEVLEPGLLFFFGCLAIAGLLVMAQNR